MTRVINDDRVFVITNDCGDIEEADLGMFYKDTRFLSRYELWINGKKPLLLSSTAENNYFKEIRLTNGIGKDTPFNTLSINRRSYIYNNGFYEQISVTNYNPEEKVLFLVLNFDADFKDMFDIRGFIEGRYGQKHDTKFESRRIIFKYSGLDNILRETIIQFNKDAEYEDGKAVFKAILSTKETFTLDICVRVNAGDNGGNDEFVGFEEGYNKIKKLYDNWINECTEIVTDNEQFNNLCMRGLTDLRALMMNFGQDQMVVGGIPWFAAPFGRDGLIAGIQSIMINPRIGRGVLRILAGYQGKETDKWNDEEPGKIFHELREGELTLTCQAPFGPYYGSHDATPLFLILLSKYFRWTGDTEFLEQMLPAAEKALSWISRYGDRDGDGFLEYIRERDGGLINQGWKDSGDSVVFSNGKLAEPPIALVEIQGYVYDAYMGMAEIYEILGYGKKAGELRNRAAALKEKFNVCYWMEDKRYFAEALDKNKKRVDSITSNPGHCLWSGIINGDKASYVADTLLNDGMFSGWGIRTMSSNEAAYKPASYHNGSVWPHDNSLIVMGFSRYGFKDHIKKVFDALLDASAQFEHYRLPELFCGYERKGNRLIKYPAACLPQAWAAAAPFALLEGILGLRVDAKNYIIELDPAMPERINLIAIKRMKVRDKSVDFIVNRNEQGNVELKVFKNEGFQILLRHH